MTQIYRPEVPVASQFALRKRIICRAGFVLFLAAEGNKEKILEKFLKIEQTIGTVSEKLKFLKTLYLYEACFDSKINSETRH